jgi:hypothetical protein
MLEAEVALWLAEFILGQPRSGATASVAIDGGSIRMGNVVVFDIGRFMARARWEPIKPPQVGRNVWSGAYRRNGKMIRMHSRPGEGDVIAQIDGRRIIAKCQKGPLARKVGILEVPLLTTALGQALLYDVSANDIVVAAVPDTLVFRRLAEAWRERPLVRRAGVRIALVARDGRHVLVPAAPQVSLTAVFGSNRHCLGESWTKSVCFEGRKVKIPEVNSLT